MSHLLEFLLIGMLFIVLLLLWALRARSAGERRGADSELLLIEGVRRPPRELVDRIFAARDWEFVSKEAGADTRKVFLRERKRIALSWLRQTRTQAGQLMRFHRRAVRRNVGLKTILEVKLAASYLAFLLLWGVLQVLIRFGGPFRAQKMAGHALGFANRMRFVSEQVLAGLNAAPHDNVNAVWTGKLR